MWRFVITCVTAWSFWLLLFWPGIMTPDSLNQWSQMLSGQLDDWHPPFHTMMNWMITNIWLSPASIAITQILALSLAVGYGLQLLWRNGVPEWAAWIICLLVALSPVNGVLVVTILKDVATAHRYPSCLYSCTKWSFLEEIGLSNHGRGYCWELPPP